MTDGKSQITDPSNDYNGDHYDWYCRRRVFSEFIHRTRYPKKAVNGNLNRRETARALGRASKRLIEKPDFEANNLGKVCAHLNNILIKREKENDTDCRHGFAQLNLLIKLQNQPIDLGWFKQQLREFHLALDYELAATAPLNL